METCTPDIGSECLVTDLVHELSAGLEIPFLLSDDIKTVEKQENDSPIDESLNEAWSEDIFFNFLKNNNKGLYIKNESINDFQSYLKKNGSVRTQSLNGFSGSGSGSDSSTEIWMTKNELDTPPVTPPDERISPDNVFYLPDEKINFIPIHSEGNITSGASTKHYSFPEVCRKVKIQPKPIFTTFDSLDSQSSSKFSVFSDVNSNNIKKKDWIESNIFINNNGKKLVLPKKDLELLQAKRKQERMIRNRESAYLSRKRKKEHVANLEKQVQELLTENKQLRLENNALRQRLSKYEELEPLPTRTKSRNIFVHSRKTTALLALLFTVCVNIGSFSFFINDKNIHPGDSDLIKENFSPHHSNEMRHTRSLLWTNLDTEGFNITFTNATKTSCPVFINQTESIRLESELRRWIGGEDDYSRKSRQNISKINQYFYSGEKPFKLKNFSKRKQRNRVGNFNYRRKTLETNMYQMKLDLLNFDTFFEAVHRRDDTFYLVSFSSDHLLLPALSHNKTSRPKMSLMLPAFLANGTGPDHVEMMQIDCEVTNTQLVSVNENSIPSQLRPYNNSNSQSKDTHESKQKNLDHFFVNGVSQNLSNVKNLEVKLDNVKSENSNCSSTEKINSYESLSGTFEVVEFENTSNSTVSNDDTLHEVEVPSEVLHKAKLANSFSNHTYKHNQNVADWVTGSGKSLLRLLMVGPTSPHVKDIDFSTAKSAGKRYSYMLPLKAQEEVRKFKDQILN